MKGDTLCHKNILGMFFQQGVQEASVWCQCHICHDNMPIMVDGICCLGHPISKRLQEREGDYSCITNYSGFKELLTKGPFDFMWKNYLCQHCDSHVTQDCFDLDQLFCDQNKMCQCTKAPSVPLCTQHTTLHQKN